MKKLRALLLSCLSFFGLYVQASELESITALNGRISLLAPKAFGPMPQHTLELKYPSSRRPSEVLSDETGGISLAFNLTHNRVQANQLAQAHSSISGMFRNLYPSATWIRSEMIEQNGASFFVMELTTPALDTEIHNILYGTSVDDRLLLATFNTTLEQAEQWLPLGQKMMASLRIN